MTNKEAIQIIEYILVLGPRNDIHWTNKAKEALEMAIVALKAQKEAIESLARVLDVPEDEVADFIEKMPQDRLEGALDHLRGDTKKIDGDLVSRKYLLAEYDKQHIGPPGGARKIIEEAPSILPTQMSGTSDAVSRNAIIRVLNTMDRYVANEITLCDTDKKFPKNEVFVVDDVYEEIVENLPSISPQRIGHWIYKDDDEWRYDSYWCSECHHEITVDAERKDDIGFTIEDMKYCNNCGAAMREGEQDVYLETMPILWQ